MLKNHVYYEITLFRYYLNKLWEDNRESLFAYIEQVYINFLVFNNIKYYTVVGDYINIMKTTFDLNFYLYQAFK